MRRSVAVAYAVASVFAVTSCGGGAPSHPPAVSDPIDLKTVLGPDVAAGATLDDDGGRVSVAFNGTAYLMVWTTEAGGLRGLRISADGAVLDAAPIAIATTTVDEGPIPAVASDGSGWMVVWQDHRVPHNTNIYGARVDASGAVLDASGFPVSTAPDHQTGPAIAFDGANYLVAWADHRSGSSWNVYGARVSPAGSVLDPNGIAICTAPAQQMAPAVAFDGQNYLAAWKDRRSGGSDIYGARVSPAGAVLDANGIAIGKASGAQTAPAAAFDGTGVVVAWQDGRSGVDRDVYAARVTRDGVVRDPSGIVVAKGAGNQGPPQLAFDGRYVAIVWKDVGTTAPMAAYAARMDATGTVLDAAPVLLAQPTGGRVASVASDGAGRALALYDVPDAEEGTAHVVGRIMTDWATLTAAGAGKGAGTMTSTPAGIDCGAACSAPFDAGTAVTLTATPDGDSVFGGWSGACSGTGACTVTMNAAASVTATFRPLHWLSVSLGSKVHGTVTSAPSGIDCGATCSAHYVEGTHVQLSPLGEAGKSVFGSWAGACSGTGPCAVTMYGPQGVVASFLPASTLTLSPSGTGMGSLAAAGATCSVRPSCKVDIATGSTVDVAATPDPASVLKSWTGCGSFADAHCSVAMTMSRSVTAKFEPASLALTAGFIGTGAGTISGAGLSCTSGSIAGCTAAVPNPPHTTTYTTVTLAAAPSSGSVFKSWSGCTQDAAAPAACSVIVNTAKRVSARFEPANLLLTAALSGTGVGTIRGAGLNCTTGAGGTCTAQVPNPNLTTAYTTVTLTASPSAGSVFKSWSGCTPSAADPFTCTVTVSSARTVTAKFEPGTIALSAVFSGAGAGTITGAGLACSTGVAGGCSAGVPNPNGTSTYSTVTLFAAPASGSVFKSWSGCTALPDRPDGCTVTVSSARTVSAKFEPSTIPLTAATSGTGAGTVTARDLPLSCTTGLAAGCTAPVPNPNNSSAYTTVTLLATPSAGSVFKSWSGCTAVDGNPGACTVAVSSARTATAKFERDAIPLTGATSGTGAGTVSGAGLSCTTGSAAGCTASVANPNNTSTYTTVTLRASPSAGSAFKSWSGCTAVADNPFSCTVIVSSARTVTAKFEPNAIRLTGATSGTGAGTVSGAGLSCATGSTAGCTAGVPNPDGSSSYTTVTLTATASSGSVFKSWSGCIPLADNPAACTVTVSSARTVTARFEPATYALSAVVTGNGSGTVSGAGLACATGATSGCTATQANGDTVTLVAAPDATSYLKSWSGCSQISGTSCTVTMTAAKTVTATFQAATLAVSVIGAGTGTVSGGPIACGTGATGTCSGTVTAGTLVTLTAAPGAKSVLAAWTGCTQVDGNVCTVDMSAAHSVVATFQPATHVLTLSFVGTGAGDVAAVVGGIATASCASAGGTCTLDEAYGATVTLVATPAAGSSFTGWSGNCTGIGQCVVTMTSARSARATFSSP